MSNKFKQFIVASMIVAIFLSYQQVNAEVPNFFIVVLSNSSLKINWTDNIADETAYQVKRKVDDGEYVTLAVVAPGAINYVDNQVTYLHEYTYQVFAMHDQEEESVTEEVTISTNLIKVPIDFIVDNPVGGDINLKWAYPQNRSIKTIIERRTEGSEEWNEINTCDEGVTTNKDDTIEAYTQYFYRIRASNDGGGYSLYSPDSNGLSIATKIEKPQNLSCLMESEDGSNHVKINWEDISEEEFFELQRKVNDEDFVTIRSDIEADTTQYVDTQVRDGAIYTYRLRGRNNASLSDYSNEAEILFYYVETPEELNATAVSSNEVELTWIDKSLSESAFEVWRTSEKNDVWQFIAKVPADEQIFKDATISNNDNYTYKIRASVSYNGAFSQFSNEVQVQMQGAFKAPDNLHYREYSENAIELFWNDNTQSETAFIIQQKLGTNPQWSDLYEVSSDTTDFQLYDLSTTEQTYLRVKVVDTDAGRVAMSSEIKIEGSKPSTPSSLKLETLASNRIKISWKDNSINEDGFMVERGYSEDDLTEIATVGKNLTEYIDSGLEGNTQYFYRISAYNQLGKSDDTTIKNEKTKELPVLLDIANDFWAYEAITSLASRGVIMGMPDGRYLPEKSITRAEFVSLLVKYFNINSQAVGNFRDVSPGKWYYTSIITAKNANVIYGDQDNYFHPDANITREDMALIVARMVKIAGKPLKNASASELDKFKDKADVSECAVFSIASMLLEKLMSGKTPTELAPKANATRAEAASLLYRVIDR